MYAGLASVRLQMGGSEPGTGDPGVRRLLRIGVEVADKDQSIGGRGVFKPGQQRSRLLVALGGRIGWVMEVRDRQEDARPAGQDYPDAVGRTSVAQLQPIERRGLRGAPRTRVLLPYSGRPAQPRIAA